MNTLHRGLNSKHSRLNIVTILVIALALLTTRTVLATPLSQLVQADSVLIQDDWSGLSMVAPIKAHYDLKRVKKGLNGKAQFSVASGRNPGQRASVKISIPSDATNRFLDILSKCKMKEGKYTPHINHTDDYPALRIEVRVGKESVVFFSESQGENHVPWAAQLKGKTYVVDSDAPARALKVLQPSLKRDTLEKLIEKQGHSNRY